MGRLVAFAAAAVGLAAGASDTEPHYHRGRLTPYDLGPPSVLLSKADEERLSNGNPVMQVLAGDDGSRRLVMVQDITVPPNVVFSRILDTERYPQMVDGVNMCSNYATNAGGPVHEVKSTYEISVLHMKFKYFMTHQYDPIAHCMTFHLDYDRKSDLDDSVGYWYVDSHGRQGSRVYYSCECKLRGWVPAPVYNVMTKEALKKATTWVEREAIKEWRTMQRTGRGDALVQFVSNAWQDVRASVEQLQPLKPPPLLASLQPQRVVGDWLQGRRRSAVQLVGAARPRKRPSSL